MKTAALLRVSAVLPLLLLLQSPLCAHVTMPSIFSDHMVLQRQKKIPVWGTADPQVAVVVDLNGREARAQADADGAWRVELPPMESGGPFTLTIQAHETRTINDVMIGEVWVCAGQSNMEFGVGAVLNHPQEVAQANYPMIRLCIIPHTVKDQPATDVSTSWASCSPASVPTFSGVGYYFGRELLQKLNVPIGLIQDTWSGTNIDGWMPHEALASDPDFAPLRERWAKKLADYPQAKADYDSKLPALTKSWQQTAEKAKAAGKPAPSQPQPPQGPGSRYTPSGIFNGQIAPIAPFAIRGIAWYQGENNVWQAFLYRKELVALINSWRTLWGDVMLPFIIIQLPQLAPAPPTTSSDWAELRESQEKALDLPATGLVVTIDLGDPEHPENLHPRNKQPVGHRLALLAEKMVYGEDMIASGPVFKSANVSGDHIQIDFENAEGLMAKNGTPLSGFEIADASGKYHPAIATINGASVILRAQAVRQPLTARYDWANNTSGNLYNAAALPARPFRSDNLPLGTQNVR